MFDTKIAIIIREDIAMWQKLNVTAFLTSGVLGEHSGLLGEMYQDADGNQYNPLVIQPMIILSTDLKGLRKIHAKAFSRNVKISLYISDMFNTSHDAENRESVMKYQSHDLDIVGIAMRADKKSVDKITKGAKMHP